MDERKMEKKELLGIEVADEKVADNEEFENSIEQAEKTLNGRKIVIALADSAHVDRDSFNYLKKAL